jgi:hypothetical protein
MKKFVDPFLMVILLVNMVLGASILRRGHEWGDDWASYVMQAQSILNGTMDEFIERNAFTVFESSVQIGPVAYPWGYPLALTPVLLLKGVHPLALKLPGFFFFAGFLICFYLLLEPRLSRTERWLLVSLFAFNPVFVGFLDYILSDIPFLFSVFLALWVTGSSERWSAGRHVLLGIFFFLAVFIRTTGIVLLAAFLADQAMIFIAERTRRKSVVWTSAIVTGGFFVLWLVSSLIFPNGQGSYFQQLAGLTVEIFLKNAHDYFFLFAQFFNPVPVGAWLYVYYALIVLFLLGMWKRWGADRMLVLFFVFYFAMMLLWPEWQGIRFIFPLLPLFFYFVFQGGKVLLARAPAKYQPAAQRGFYLFWVALVGVFLFQSASQAYTNIREQRKINGPFDAFSQDLYNYIRTETPADSVIVFFKPRALRLFTDRDAIMSIECERLLLGDYVALHKTWEYSQILPADIQRCNLPLKNVYENRKFILYEVEK